MYVISAIICIALVALDRLSKLAALRYLKPIQSVTAIKGFLDFTFVENRGAAFGILSGQRLLFVIITIVVCAGIAYSYVKMPKTKEYRAARLSFALIVSGAVGNLIDRALNGYVIDFLEFTFIRWPVFNFADIYIVVGAAILAYATLFVFKESDDGKEK